jgi:hypothetical protein
MEESMQPQLKSLGERLLRAGVAHRHVRRYIRELREHYEDAVREELAKGLDRSQAERAAWSRLGSEEELARSVLAQPDVRVLPVMLGVVFVDGIGTPTDKTSLADHRRSNRCRAWGYN